MSFKPTARDWSLTLEPLVRWEQFGVLLPEIKSHDVDKIKKQEDDIEENKRALWTKWTTVYPNGSWNDVIEALRKIRENALANEIEKKFATDTIAGGGNLPTTYDRGAIKRGEGRRDCGPPVSVELNITHLNDILTALERAYFGLGEWSRLGLGLGLYQPTLATIERNCRGIARECMSECLTQWLQKVDGVHNKGGPTQIALVNAMESIDKAAAQRIKLTISQTSGGPGDNSGQSGRGAGVLEQPTAQHSGASFNKEPHSSSTTNGRSIHRVATDGLEDNDSSGAHPIPDRIPDPPTVSEGDCPPKSIIPSKHVPFSPDLVEGVYIILMTVTDDEYCTVMAKTKPLNKGDFLITATTIEEGGINICLGRFGKYKVAIMQTEPGQKEIPTVLPKLLHHVKARYIISIGMCYGMNEKKRKFGDVLVSSCIHDISHEHRGKGGSEFQDKQYHVKDKISAKFKESNGFALPRSEGDNVQVAVGSIVSRSTVVKDSEYKGDVLKQIPRALGGEMEGHAIVTAVRSIHFDAGPEPEVIVIKGIADWGDGDKEGSRKWQPFASHAAASYVLFHMKNYMGLGIEN